MKAGGRCLATVLAVTLIALLHSSPCALAVEAPEPPRLLVNVAGGFAGYAVPLPDFAARIWLSWNERESSAGLVYNDLSLTPIHLQLRGNGTASSVEVVVRNHSTALALPPAQAYLTEFPGAGPQLQEDSLNVRLVRREQVALPPAGEVDVYIPLQVYPRPAGAGSATVEVEVWRDGDLVETEVVALKFLPRGRVYSCLVEEEGSGLLAADELKLAGLPASEVSLLDGAYQQTHQLVSVAARNLGPDFRILRHFAFVLVSATTWERLGTRERELLTDATAMGSRLVVFSCPSAVQVAGAARRPQPSLSFSAFGFGKLALSSSGLAALRPELAEFLGRRLENAYYFSQRAWERLDEEGLRTQLATAPRAGVNAYDWLGAMSSQSLAQGGVNPLWVYDYLNRPGLLHPLDDPVLHWRAARAIDASSELSQSSGSDSLWLLQSFDRNLRLHSLARVLLFAAIFTVVVLIVAALWFTIRGSYRWLTIALLVLSLASITVFVLRTRDSLQGSIESTVVTISLGCAESSLSDVRRTAYFYSAISSPLQAKLSAQGFVLGRIAPLEDKELIVHVTGGDSVTLENLPVEPLLPLVVDYSEVRTEIPLLKHNWETTDDGERLLVLTGTGPTVEHLFLVTGTRSAYIGELREGETRVVVLPAEAREAEPLQLTRKDDLAERALVNRGGGVVDSHSAEGEEGLRGIVIDRLYYLIWHEVLRMLMAHGDGTTLVGLRYGDYPLALGGKETPSAHCELVVYRLQ